jgi:hypothetical protein
MRLYITGINPKDIGYGKLSNVLVVREGERSYIYSESSTLLDTDSGLRRIIYIDGEIEPTVVGGQDAVIDFGKLEYSDIELQIPVPSTEVTIMWREYTHSHAKNTRFVTEFLDKKCIDCYFESSTSSLTSDAATFLEHLKFC